MHRHVWSTVLSSSDLEVGCCEWRLLSPGPIGSGLFHLTRACDTEKTYFLLIIMFNREIANIVAGLWGASGATYLLFPKFSSGLYFAEKKSVPGSPDDIAKQTLIQSMGAS